MKTLIVEKDDILKEFENRLNRLPIVGFVSFIDGFWSVLSVIIGFGGMIILICKFLY